VQVRELSIPHAWEFTPEVHRDERGEFHEFYRFEMVQDAVGHPLTLRQGNSSVSSKGVLRGIHYALVPPGQAKYVTAVRGAFIDFVIDIRLGSPTFGQWDSVVIDDVAHNSVYLAEGLGHAILALTENATINYLVSEVYNASRELGVSPFDPDIGLQFPSSQVAPVTGMKDAEAPSLGSAAAAGNLPDWQDCLALYTAQRG
jgi:dTDP-4-dehydrorhamnose 3,5-epimerase